jgi:hypothetical protein
MRKNVCRLRTYKNLKNAQKSIEAYVFSDAPFYFRKRILTNGKVRIYTYEIGADGKVPVLYKWFTPSSLYSDWLRTFDERYWHNRTHLMSEEEKLSYVAKYGHEP